MNSQTARRPEDKQPARTTKSKKYSKQTAFYVDTRRDGTPLIFGWGGHLSRQQKTAIQRVAIWSVITLTIILVLVVFVGFWINLNIVVPNQPISSVNGQNIPQSDYHKMVVVRGQLEENDTKGPKGLYAQQDALKKKFSDQEKTLAASKKSVDDLTKQVKDATGTKKTDLEGQLKTAKQKQTDDEKLYNSLKKELETLTNTTIPNKVALYNQSQIGNESVQWLQENILITNWLTKQNADVKNKITPTDAAVEKAYADFKANLPKSKSYDKFLSSSYVGDGDVKNMLRLKVLRDNMQSYLSSSITSPAKQVQVSGIYLATEKEAQDVRKDLLAGKDFAKLAKDKSLDNDTKDKGGNLGWLARGQYTKDKATNLGVTVDNWLFDDARKEGELSPVLKEGGTFRLVRIDKIDPARALENAQLKALQDNALDFWVLQQKALPGVKIGTIDNDKLFDPMNMPKDIPSSAPAQNGNAIPNSSAPGGTNAQGGTTQDAGGQP